MPDASTQAILPEKPTVDGLEATWTARWDEQDTYRFNRDTRREDVFSIDTPPPTVSGELHIGHVFSYTQGDVIARFWRMRGKNVFYPLGWDDNGVPTEQRVENYYGVRCDPSLPYNPNFTPPESPDEQHKLSIGRRNFVELCEELPRSTNRPLSTCFEPSASRWTGPPSTPRWAVSPAASRKRRSCTCSSEETCTCASLPHCGTWTFKWPSPRPSLRIANNPVLSPDRLSSRRRRGHIEVDTTRPELLAGFVAVVAHPEDPRFAHLFGTFVRTPLYSVDVPVVAHSWPIPRRVREPR